MRAASKTASWAAGCCVMVAAFEGCDYTAKKDMIGTGQPLTWCHGETIGNVRPGQKFTKAECAAMLTARLPQYWAAIEPCIRVKTSDNEKKAYTSTSYNIGSAAFCRSSMVRELNRGNHKGACDALMLYTRARGKYVQGLANRRAAERKTCLTPDSAPISKPVQPPASKGWTWPKIFTWTWWTEE